MGTAKVGEDPGATEMPSAVRPPTVAAGALLLGAGGARPGPQTCPASASRRPTAAARFRCVFVCSLCGGSRSLLACFVSRMNLETKRRPLGLGRHDNCISDSQLLELSSRPPSPWLPTKERRPPPPGRGERRGGTGGSEGRAGGRWGEVRPSGAGREGARGRGGMETWTTGRPGRGPGHHHAGQWLWLRQITSGSPTAGWGARKNRLILTQTVPSSPRH